MQADIITVGDEILIGQIIDTNANYLAGELSQLGFFVRKIHSVGDNSDSIIDTLDDSIQNSDLTILTGGLGPTNDDITKKTLNQYFNGKFVVHEETLNKIRHFFSIRNRKLTERNAKQAEIPDNCEPLLNRIGTAPGMLFRKNKCTIISLPGVPFEMKDLFENEVKPRLRQNFKLPVRLKKTILTVGLPESYAADKLRNFEKNLEECFSLAYLPSPGILRLRLSISGNNIDYLKEKLNKKVTEIIYLLDRQNVYGFDDDSLPEIIGKLLIKHKFKITVAESCTGGYIAHQITLIPGASEYFTGSVIAYSNNIKEELLGVNANSIRSFGAVSREVVESMAKGVRDRMKSDFSIATSGIAGPDGGSSQKPVGTTWIAIATPENVISKQFLFGEDRERNIIRASVTAMNMLRIAISDYVKNSK